MAIEIGVAYLSIVPSTRGMIRDIKQSLNRDGNRAARHAGRRMGENLGEEMGKGMAKADPFDHLRASVKKSEAELNRFNKDMQASARKVSEATDRVRLANARYGEALRRTNASDATLMSLRMQVEKANRALEKSNLDLAEADSRRSVQMADRVKRENDLQRALKLRAQAEKAAEMSRQSVLDRWRSRRAGLGSGGDLVVEVDVDGNAVTARQKVAALTRELSERYKVHIDVDVDRGRLSRLRQGMRRAFSTAPAENFQRATQRSIDSVTGALGKFAAQIPGTWIVLGTLGSIGVITLMPLIAAVSQLAGLLAALPATISGVGAAFASLATGAWGVFKALGAGFKAASQGATAAAGGGGNGRQLERAHKQAARAAADGARQVAEAERALARAQREATKAQEELSEARREAAKDIEDLNFRLQQSQLDEEGAILGVRRAYESLRETMGSGDSSSLDRAEARHRYKEAIANLERTRRATAELAEETAEANEKGIEGHDSVVAANERVEASHEAVEDAQRGVERAVEAAARANEDAAEAIADAAAAGGAGAAATDEYGEALAKLSPAAREFVETVMSLRDAWGQVAYAAQEALFTNMGPAFRRFSETYIPILTEGLAGYNEEFSNFFVGIMDRMSSPEIAGVWESFFTHSREGLSELLPGFQNLGESFAKISEIGARAFPRIGEAIREWSERVLDWVNKNPDRILGWIEKGATAFGKLATTAFELGRLVVNILAPNIPRGESMWDSLNNTLREWADTIGSPEKQQQIADFFNSIVDAVKAIGSLATTIDEWTKGGSLGARLLGFAPESVDEDGEETGRWDARRALREGGKGVYTKDELYSRGQAEPGGGGAGGSFRKDGEEKPKMKHGSFGGGGASAPQPQVEPSGQSVSEALLDPQNWAEQFSNAGDSISATWNEKIQPITEAWNTGWEGAKTKFGEFKDGASQKWTELSTSVQTWYNSHIAPTLSKFTDDSTLTGNLFGIATGIMKGDWSSVGENVQSIVDNHIAPTLGRLGEFVERTKGRFRETVEGIKTKWSELKAGTASVVNWIIDNVWNSGFVKAWSSAARFLPIPDAVEMPRIPGYREGGRVDGKGTSTSDSILARLSRGEHVWDAMDVRRAGGHNTVYAIRALIEKGIPFTWDTVQGLASRGKSEIDAMSYARLGVTGDLGLPGYRRGGAVDEPEPAWIGQLARGHEFAQKIAPGPYVLGGSSGGRPGGATDCSGFMSEIADVILGGPGGQRKWATGNFPGPQAGAWASGLGQGFSVGILHGGPGGGHTAGTLSGVRGYSAVNVESGGNTGQGATYGGAAVGADHSQFTEQHHLKIGADGAFESAGGPSPEAQRGMLKKLLTEIFEKIISPVGSAIDMGFSPPPHIDAIPGATFDDMSAGIKEETFSIVDSLGDTLRSVYDKAQEVKDVVANVVSNVAGFFRGGLLRDTGGILPTGTSLVRNETGKPEQILNWRQIEEIQRIMRDAMRLARDLGTQFDRQEEAELIAEAIGRRLEETDWEHVAFRLEAFSAQLEKIGKSAAESYADDALGVFGLRNGRKRWQEFDAFARALRGEGAGDLEGVTPPSAVIAGDYSYSRQLPHLEQSRQAIETKLPDIAESTGSAVKDQVRQAFAPYGWDKEPYWSAMDWIIGKESSWNPTIANPSSGAFGLFQFNPSSGTLQEFLPDRNPDPSVQGAAGARYVKSRYGDPLKAKAFWEQNGWYDRGGVLKPGRTLAQNNSGKDELILTNEQWRYAARTAVEVNRMAELAPAALSGGGRSGGDTWNIHAVDVHGAVRDFRREDARRAQMRVGIR